MRMESPAGSKALVCCDDDTYGSNKSSTLAENRTGLEEIEAGVIHSPESVYTEYPDP